VAVAAAFGALTSLVGPVGPAVAGVGPAVAEIGPAVTGVGHAVVNRPAAPPAVNAVASNDNVAVTSELAYQPGQSTSRGGKGETVNVVIPAWEGALTLTVSDAPVQLSSKAVSADKKTVELTGALPVMTIEDYRFLSVPGWRVTGQVSDFTGGGPKLSGSYLGWTPEIIEQDANRDAVAGPAVSPGTRPGLADPSTLASAAATGGTGNTVIGATLDLKVPSSSLLGSQAATLSITLVESA
jgi:hypothetical protein